MFRRSESSRIALVGFRQQLRLLLRYPLAARPGQAVSACRTCRIDLINMAPAMLVQSARRAGRCARPVHGPGSAVKGRTSMRTLLRLSLAVMALVALAPAVLSQQA